MRRRAPPDSRPGLTVFAVLELIAGGVITLIVTSLVQVFVIPNMQAKNRRIERWENDVGELRALLEEQLPRAHDTLHSTGVQMRFLTAWKGTVDANEAGEARMAYIEETLRSATAAFRDASESVGELMARMQRIEGRIKMRNREAAYLARLASKRITLRVAMFDVERDPSWGGKQLDDAAYDAAWDKVRRGATTCLRPSNRWQIR
jgi:hypothetical protein